MLPSGLWYLKVKTEPGLSSYNHAHLLLPAVFARRLLGGTCPRTQSPVQLGGQQKVARVLPCPAPDMPLCLLSQLELGHLSWLDVKSPSSLTVPLDSGKAPLSFLKLHSSLICIVMSSAYDVRQYMDYALFRFLCMGLTPSSKGSAHMCILLRV